MHVPDTMCSLGKSVLRVMGVEYGHPCALESELKREL